MTGDRLSCGGFDKLPANSPRRQPPARLHLTPFRPGALKPGFGLRKATQGTARAGLSSLGRVQRPSAIRVGARERAPTAARLEARQVRRAPRRRPTFTNSSISGSLSSPLAVAESVMPPAPRATVPGRGGATSAAPRPALCTPAPAQRGLSSERRRCWFSPPNLFLKLGTATSERSVSRVIT